MRTNNGVDVIGATQDADLSRTQVDELEHGDSVDQYQAVAVTDEGVYGVPGNASEAAVKNVTGADEAYVRSIGSDDQRTSASAYRASSDQVDELAAMADSPFAILDGVVQERQGHSTDAVYEFDTDIDQI